jgi:hypothetical protein
VGPGEERECGGVGGAGPFLGGARELLGEDIDAGELGGHAVYARGVGVGVADGGAEGLDAQEGGGLFGRGEDLLDDLCAAAALVHLARDVLHGGACVDKMRAVGVC